MGLGEEARGGIGECEEGCAGGGGEGEEFALVVAGDEAGDVGAEEPDEADGAADGDDGGGHDGGEDEGDPAEAVDG